MILNIMKIRPKFIDLIKSGKKKREYRLCDETRQSIRIGDRIVLVSNQNHNEYVAVIVTDKKVFKNWDDALEEYWKEDFSGLYSTKEEALRECFRFYQKERVDKYGIVVFSIEEDKPDFKNASFLLDTNVIVYRESSNNVLPEYPEFFKILDKIGAKKYIHPKTKKEIESNGDEDVKKVMLSKLNSYDCLTPSVETDELFDEVISKYKIDKNSLIDNEILLQVYCGRVQFLITEDDAIHAKAKELYLENRVLNASCFLGLFKEQHPDLVDYKILSIVQRKIGDLDFHDKFFDSLREDYNFGKGSFDKWLNKKASEDAYVYEDSGELKGFLYLKAEYEKEKYDDISPKFEPKKRLKIGTFKIVAKGMRISERFLKIIFDNAKVNKVDEIYVTLFEGKRDEVDALRDILFHWGF